MIVSRHTAVLPVCRSPMISWRWPRPMAVMASMALMPVAMDSLTGWRWTTVGACSSRARRVLGLDRAAPVDRVAQRVDHPAQVPVADGHREDLAGALDRLPLLDHASRRRAARRRSRGRRGSGPGPAGRPRTRAARWSSPSAGPRPGRSRRRSRRRGRPPRARSPARTPRRCARSRLGSLRGGSPAPSSSLLVCAHPLGGAAFVVVPWCLSRSSARRACSMRVATVASMTSVADPHRDPADDRRVHRDVQPDLATVLMRESGRSQPARLVLGRAGWATRTSAMERPRCSAARSIRSSMTASARRPRRCSSSAPGPAVRAAPASAAEQRLGPARPWPACPTDGSVSAICRSAEPDTACGEREQLVLDRVERPAGLGHHEGRLRGQSLDRLDQVGRVRPALRDHVGRGRRPPRARQPLAEEGVDRAQPAPRWAGRRPTGPRAAACCRTDQVRRGEQLGRSAASPACHAAPVEALAQPENACRAGARHGVTGDPGPGGPTRSRPGASGLDSSSAMNRSTVARARASSVRLSPTILLASCSASSLTSRCREPSAESRSAWIWASARAATAAAAASPRPAPR